MVKVVELKERAIERLEGYRDDPRTLPGLVFARYRSTVSTTNGGSRRVKPQNFALRNHKPHQMHLQHRINCLQVLQWLVKRMDIKTRQCVFVNPTYNIRRTIYVPEIARHLSLSERTVTRCLGSIQRAGYLLRTLFGKEQMIHHFFLTERLFRDLKLDVTLNVLTRKMLGLDEKGSKKDKAAGAAKPFRNAKSSTTQPQVPPAPTETPKPYAHKEQSAASREVGNSFLDQLRPRRRKPPG